MFVMFAILLVKLAMAIQVFVLHANPHLICLLILELALVNALLTISLWVTMEFALNVILLVLLVSIRRHPVFLVIYQRIKNFSTTHVYLNALLVMNPIKTINVSLKD